MSGRPKQAYDQQCHEQIAGIVFAWIRKTRWSGPNEKEKPRAGKKGELIKASFGRHDRDIHRGFFIFINN